MKPLTVVVTFDVLKQFSYADELAEFPVKYVDDRTYHYGNPSFLSGDADFWYSFIRSTRPGRIVEIGSGNSTKAAQAAIAKNRPA